MLKLFGHLFIKKTSLINKDFMNKELNKNFLLVIFMSLFLSACFNTKSSKRYDFTEHALNIDISNNAEYVLISNSLGYVDLVDFSSFSNNNIGQWAHEKGPGAGVIASDFSNDNKFVVTASQKTIARYSIVEEKVVNYWSLDNISDIKMSANGEFAFVASAEKKDDQYGKYLHFRVVYFHLPYGKIKYAFYHDDKISTIDLSIDGRYGVTGSDDTKARLWDLETGELKYTWPHNSKVSKVKFSDNGRYVMTNNASGEIKIWKTETGKLYQKLKLPDATVSAAIFSPNGKYIATALTREKLIFWNLNTGKKVKTIYPARRYFWQSSLSRITAVQFLNNKKLLSITSRGIAQLWRF
jgi:WD40 repeat protein